VKNNLGEFSYDGIYVSHLIRFPLFSLLTIYHDLLANSMTFLPVFEVSWRPKDFLSNICEERRACWTTRCYASIIVDGEVTSCCIHDSESVIAVRVLNTSTKSSLNPCPQNMIFPALITWSQIAYVDTHTHTHTHTLSKYRSTLVTLPRIVTPYRDNVNGTKIYFMVGTHL
jgi:hypothetical protein